jgi:NodT family efflux transporter outer membrane factor (OMF) lipoprotein
MNRPLYVCATLACLLALSSCAVGPNYHRPEPQAVLAYKEQGDWKASEPADSLDRDPWWQIFDDPVLNDLERQIDVSNQNLKASWDAYMQSRAVVLQAKNAYWPTVDVTAERQRSNQILAAKAVQGVNSGGAGAGASGSWTAGASGSWSLDIWGGTRRTVESDRDSAQASHAAVALARLSAQASLATDYFELRAQDSLQQLLNDTVKDDQNALTITEARFKYGVAGRADVVTAETQLLTSQASLVNVELTRGQLEHAIALLIGKTPADFTLEPAPLRSDVPSIPPGMASTLLERRPDIAQAERRMAAANAQIGVGISAFFPTLTLAGNASYTSSAIRGLLSASNGVWAVGPELAATLFDVEGRRAVVRQARAAYAEAIDNYRQTVLTSFQQVEDNLLALRVLEHQASIETLAVTAAKEAEKLTLEQYKAGTVPYTSVITAQTTTFSSEQTALTVLQDRLTASVALIQAVGGGWRTSRMAKD